MENGNGHESGSETSSDSSLSDDHREPCEICGSADRENLIMTCETCRDTREHTYCGRICRGYDSDDVPDIWICDKCLALEDDDNGSADNQEEEAEEDQNVPSINQEIVPSGTDQAEDNNDDSIDQIVPSGTNQVEEEDSVDPIALPSISNQVEESTEDNEEDSIDQTVPQDTTI